MKDDPTLIPLAYARPKTAPHEDRLRPRLIAFVLLWTAAVLTVWAWL